MTIVTGDNIFANTTYVVDPEKGRGTHQTFSAAVAEASAGETIGVRPGTYTEDWTLKSDVNVYAMGSGANSAGDVLVNGKITVGTAERLEIKGIRFENNGDIILEDTGSSTDTINFVLCTFAGDGSNNMFESSNTTKNFLFDQCVVNCPSGSKVLDSSGGSFTFRHCTMTAGASTISTLSAGSVNFHGCLGSFPFQTTGSASYTSSMSTFSTSNQICIDSQGSGGGIMQTNDLRTNGTVAAMNIGAGSTVVTTGLKINTVNSTPITGAGNIWYDDIGFIQGGNHTIAPTRLGGALRVGLLRLETSLGEIYGGTGQNSYTAGDILFASGSNTLDKLSVGNDGDLLTLDSGLPSWSQVGGGINGLSGLTLNQGFEYSTHCVEVPNPNTLINVANGSVVNTDPRSGQAALHPGQWRWRLEDSATARAVMQESSAAATRPLLLGGGTWVQEVLVNFETLSTASDEYVAMWGLADARANDAITDGIFFEYDRTNSVNYIGVTESSGTRTEVDSGVAVSTTASTWVKLRIEINAAASSVEFFVNGTSIGTSITNIPSTDLQFFVRAIKSASTGAQNVFYMDYFYLRNQLTTEI